MLAVPEVANSKEEVSSLLEESEHNNVGVSVEVVAEDKPVDPKVSEYPVLEEPSSSPNQKPAANLMVSMISEEDQMRVKYIQELEKMQDAKMRENMISMMEMGYFNYQIN